MAEAAESAAAIGLPGYGYAVSLFQIVTADMESAYGVGAVAPGNVNEKSVPVPEAEHSGQYVQGADTHLICAFKTLPLPPLRVLGPSRFRIKPGQGVSQPGSRMRMRPASNLSVMGEAPLGINFKADNRIP